MRSQPPRASLVLVAAVAAFGAAAHAETASNRVETIDVGATRDGAEIVLQARTRPEFSLFRLSNPARVVVDLPGVDVGAAKAPSLDNHPLVSSVTTTQFRGQNGPVGRVVAVLKGEVEVDAAARGSAVVITVKSNRAAEPAAKPAKAAATDAPTVIELEGEPDAASAASRLLGVEARAQTDGSLVLVRTNGTVARYEVQEVADPARLVIDLFGVKADGNAERSFADSAVQKARIGKHADKARVVLEARAGLPHYDVASTGDGLAILFSGAAVQQKAASLQLRETSLEARAGFHRITLDVGGQVSIRTVKNTPTEKVIALDGVKAAAALTGSRGHRGGPIADVVIAGDPTKADALRIEMKTTGDVEHSAWQRDGKVYWDVRPVGQAPLAQADRSQPAAAPFATMGQTVSLAKEGVTAATYRGRKITIDLMDADIVNVIRLIGDVSGKNVVVADDVKGKVTLKLKNVPWDQALDVILKTKDLGQETRGGIIRVVLQAKLDAERESRLKYQEDREKKLPTTVRLIPVNYAVAKELVPQVKELLSARGKVTNDERTNVIIVEDIRDNLDQAERLVRTLDTQTPQVLIEARMVEGTTTFTRALGIQWGGGLFFSQRGGNPTGLVFPNNVGLVGGADDVQSLQGQPTPGVFFPPNFAVNLPAQNVSSGVGLNLGSIGNFGFVNARLTAAEASGQAKVISAPRITTLNNKRARITQGTDISVPIVTQNQFQVQQVTAALELDVTPHVTPDGSILMAIRLTNNVPDFSQQVNGGVPPIATKEAETEMLVQDGDTAVIGGIYTRNQAENYAQTPFLGSIPILGWLFKSYNESDTRTEMLVFITPRIINRNSATPQTGGI